MKKTIGWNGSGQPILEIIDYTVTREQSLLSLAGYIRDPWDVGRAKITPDERFRLWPEKKAVKQGDANGRFLRAAYHHCAALAKRP